MRTELLGWIGNRGEIPDRDKTRPIHKIGQTKVSDDCYISCWKLLVSGHIHCHSLRKYRYFRVKCAVLHLLSNNPRVVCVFECERFKSWRASCLRPVWEVSVLGRLTCGIASLAELHFFCSWLQNLNFDSGLVEFSGCQGFLHGQVLVINCNKNYRILSLCLFSCLGSHVS